MLKNKQCAFIVGYHYLYSPMTPFKKISAHRARDIHRLIIAFFLEDNPIKKDFLRFDLFFSLKIFKEKIILFCLYFFILFFAGIYGIGRYFSFNWTFPTLILLGFSIVFYFLKRRRFNISVIDAYKARIKEKKIVGLPMLDSLKAFEREYLDHLDTKKKPLGLQYISGQRENGTLVLDLVRAMVYRQIENDRQKIKKAKKVWANLALNYQNNIEKSPLYRLIQALTGLFFLVFVWFFESTIEFYVRDILQDIIFVFSRDFFSLRFAFLLCTQFDKFNFFDYFGRILSYSIAFFWIFGAFFSVNQFFLPSQFSRS